MSTASIPATGEDTMAAGQQRARELARRGAPLGEVLAELVRTAEASAGEEVIASILLLDEDGKRLRHGAAPGLPAEYNAAIDGILIGPTVGSCGTAAYSGHTIMVQDVATDPLWADFKSLALAHGLRACWSLPIRSAGGAILGTFALYHRVPMAPTFHDRQIVERLAKTAATILEEARQQAPAANALAGAR